MKKIIILLIGIVLAFNAMSCRVDNDDLIEKIIILENIKSSENTEKDEEIEEPKDEDDVDESKDDSEKKDEENNTVVENKTWCDITEDTNILELNYFVCVDGSPTKLDVLSTDKDQARKYGFRVSAFVPISEKKAVFSVEYKDGKLNFSDNNIDDIYKIYTITDVTMEGSNINITIEWN